MKLAPNPFTQAIRSGKKQIGLWVSLSSSFAADVVAPAGYDWVLLDMEHSPGELSSVLGQLQVFAASDTLSIVRPDWNDAVKVKRLLDIGAPGLLFPMVQSVEEAEQAVAATRYPPRGIRGVSGSTRANAFGRTSDYFARVEDETAVLVQLETKAAVEKALDIGAVDGVDGVFFGPADIAADIGLLGKPMDSTVWDLIMPAAKALIANGVPVGTLVLDAAFAAKLLNNGFTFVACGSDTALLAKGADSLLASVKGNLA
ncbi:MAG: 4-hydroxy-2-oxo-heptane-1,7-dioate aldolase [Hyphomicrobiaceae bacterium]